MHEALPGPACPFSWMAEDRLAVARRRAAGGLVDPAGWHEDHRHFGLGGALGLPAASRRSTGWSSATATRALPTR